MRSTGLAIAFSAVLAGAALADDVTDAIEAGRKSYADGELAKAKEALGLASQLIGQKHAEAYAKLLPAPLVGWKADEVEILGKALRRGLLEIYKAVVLHELETGRIDRKEASRLLGSRVVERALAETGAGVRSPQRPGPRKMPRRRNR